MNASVTLEIIKSILIYGPKAVMKISEVMQDEDITVSDIKNLFITKDPEEYFK